MAALGAKVDALRAELRLDASLPVVGVLAAAASELGLQEEVAGLNLVAQADVLLAAVFGAPQAEVVMGQVVETAPVPQEMIHEGGQHVTLTEMMRTADGVRFSLYPNHPCADCMYCVFSCGATLICPHLAVTFKIKVIDDRHFAATDNRFCNMFPASPCPCCLYCGFGPCGFRAMWEVDANDPTRWVGRGSVLACCSGADGPCSHEGDVTIIDFDHNGRTKESAIFSSIGHGDFYPPCLHGQPNASYAFVTNPADAARIRTRTSRPR